MTKEEKERKAQELRDRRRIISCYFTKENYAYMKVLKQKGKLLNRLVQEHRAKLGGGKDKGTQ